ncbi:hypothetical protein [Enterovirga aerilata]|uniref:Uncharacterized protein n=1 Tax=Enterovirga aerilata TaxID=2730920 RepID=A0A849IE29_9HYPH|nr:hypothetical protein [Enterovirga sp. DB1703]NNM74290.1 hypothetical protein [Enterovirga sp. DB1703]
MRRLLALALCVMPLGATAEELSRLECATYRAALTASGESVKALARGAREIELSSLRGKVDEDTRRAIARLEDANANLQPVMEEWARAAEALAERIKVLCSR